MTLIYVIISVLIITLLAYGFNRLKILPWVVCPICVGVSLTWLGLLALKFFFAREIDPLLLATLMGGSVVGFDYTIDKWVKPKQLLLSKTLVILSGFAAVYTFLNDLWFWTAVALALMVTFTLWFTRQGSSTTHPEHKKVQDIEDKLSNCC